VNRLAHTAGELHFGSNADRFLSVVQCQHIELIADREKPFVVGFPVAVGSKNSAAR
jgi:hypothetical protein